MIRIIKFEWPDFSSCSHDFFCPFSIHLFEIEDEIERGRGRSLTDDRLTWDEVCKNEICNSLTWDKVFKPENDQLTLTVRFPKVMHKGTSSQAVDIYKYMDTNYCPIFQLASLYNMAKDHKNINASDHVFELKSGKMLTMPYMNLIIRNIMTKFFNGAHRFSCHSFRAGVPSWMAANPHLFDEQEIKVIGRWSSQTYLRYTRLSGITRSFAPLRFC